MDLLQFLFLFLPGFYLFIDPRAFSKDLLGFFLVIPET
jgi:hypothetical protein